MIRERYSDRLGFTLIELLVVIVILGILVGTWVDSRLSAGHFRTLVTVMILLLGLSLVFGLGQR